MRVYYNGANVCACLRALARDAFASQRCACRQRWSATATVTQPCDRADRLLQSACTTANLRAPLSHSLRLVGGDAQCQLVWPTRARPSRAHAIYTPAALSIRTRACQLVSDDTFVVVLLRNWKATACPRATFIDGHARVHLLMNTNVERVLSGCSRAMRERPIVVVVFALLDARARSAIRTGTRRQRGRRFLARGDIRSMRLSVRFHARVH